MWWMNSININPLFSLSLSLSFALHSNSQYSGAMVVMLGIVIVLIPEFMKKEGDSKEEVGENQR